MRIRKNDGHLDGRRTFADLEDNNLWPYPFIQQTPSVEYFTIRGEGDAEWVRMLMPSVRKMSRGADLEGWPHYFEGIFYTRGQWIDIYIASLDEIGNAENQIVQDQTSGVD